MAFWQRVAAALRRRYVVAVVRGHSMSPTFTDGQRVSARRAEGRRIRPGDVIVFHLGDGPPASLPGNPQYRIKRVAAVPGDPLPGWLPVAAGASGKVPDGHFVVRGDNPRSEDSRHLGLVPRAAVLGVLRRPRMAYPAPPAITSDPPARAANGS